MARAKKPAAVEAAVQDVAAAPSDGSLAYRVVWHVKHGGHLFQPGDTVYMDAATAAGLLEAGAIASINEG